MQLKLIGLGALVIGIIVLGSVLSAPRPASADPPPSPTPPVALPTGTLKFVRWDFVEIDLIKQLRSALTWNIQNTQAGDEFRMALYIGVNGGVETLVQTYTLPTTAGTGELLYQPVSATNYITFSYDIQYQRGGSGWQTITGAHVYDMAPVPKVGIANSLTINTADKAPNQASPTHDSVRMTFHFQNFETWVYADLLYRDVAGTWHTLGDVTGIISQTAGMRAGEIYDIPKSARDASGNQTVRLRMFRDVEGYPTLTYSNIVTVSFAGS